MHETNGSFWPIQSYFASKLPFATRDWDTSKACIKFGTLLLSLTPHRGTKYRMSSWTSSYSLFQPLLTSILQRGMTSSEHQQSYARWQSTDCAPDFARPRWHSRNGTCAIQANKGMQEPNYSKMSIVSLTKHTDTLDNTWLYVVLICFNLRQPALPRACVSVRACARLRACVRACVRAGSYACVS